jgi:hypothetical protein
MGSGLGMLLGALTLRRPDHCADADPEPFRSAPGGRTARYEAQSGILL